MSDRIDSSVGPVLPVNGTRPVQPVRTEPDQPAGAKAALGHGVGAATGGSLPPAYSEFVVDADTHDIVLQVKDAATNQILSQYPSREVEAVAAFMNRYAATLARRKAALKSEFAD